MHWIEWFEGCPLGWLLIIPYTYRLQLKFYFFQWKKLEREDFSKERRSERERKREQLGCKNCHPHYIEASWRCSSSLALIHMIPLAYKCVCCQLCVHFFCFQSVYVWSRAHVLVKLFDVRQNSVFGKMFQCNWEVRRYHSGYENMLFCLWIKYVTQYRILFQFTIK